MTVKENSYKEPDIYIDVYIQSMEFWKYTSRKR